ncbi:MAG: NAD(+)/NADH kinase [Thermodesulfobacteriota bacterium]
MYRNYGEMVMKSIGVMVKPNHPEAVEACGEVAAWLVKRGIGIYVDAQLAQEVESAKGCSLDEMSELVDLIIVLGGDGTILHAARLLNGRKTPILGLNLGGLGFLTAVKQDELYLALERAIRDEFEVEERMMLSVTVYRDDREISNYSVLNDAVVKGTHARLISLETRINEEYVNTYRADGLIVATPTGSTAYSLSSGGPILYPTIHSIILAPICPFNLTNRSVVIPDWMEIKVIIRGEYNKPILTMDGQLDMPLGDGDVIDIKRSESSIYLMKCPGKSYFDILRERLLWERKGH